MKSFKQFINEHNGILEASTDATPDSWLVVDGIAKDKWIVDRFVPNRPRSGGMVGSPFKKKSQALKKAKEIARATGEEVKIGRAPALGGPEVLRKKRLREAASNLHELDLTVVGDAVQSKDGSVWFPIEIKYDLEDVKSGIVARFEKALRKKGHGVVSNTVPLKPADRFGFDFKLGPLVLTFRPAEGPFAQIAVANAKNQKNAIAKIERIATLTKLTNPIFTAVRNVKKLIQLLKR